MNKITFYSYPAGSITSSGKSLAGHMFIEFGQGGHVLGWNPTGQGDFPLKDDCRHISLPGLISAPFYVGDTTLKMMQDNINNWLRMERRYIIGFQDCVTFAKSFIDIINNNILPGQQTIPDTWSKFPDSVARGLQQTSTRFGLRQIAR